MRVEWEENFEAFRRNIWIEVKPRMTATVKMLVGEARQLCPVRTGRLKKSLTWEVSQNGETGWYGSNRPWRGEASVPYAIYQEVGFKHWRSGNWIPGKKYLRTPLITKKPEIARIWAGYKLRVAGIFEK